MDRRAFLTASKAKQKHANQPGPYRALTNIQAHGILKQPYIY